MVVSSLVSCLCYSTGNLIRVVDMPPYWRWFTHINFLYYAWAALMKDEFEGCGTVFVGGSTVSYFCPCRKATRLCLPEPPAPYAGA